ncbi:MAG: hypothetical protein JW819_01620 [Candidatus Krumholzibacteriota bacterium]|nr:hypothetical protein [Candidatus Krumholzibacteriota bacterium]
MTMRRAARTSVLLAALLAACRPATPPAGDHAGLDHAGCLALAGRPAPGGTVVLALAAAADPAAAPVPATAAERLLFRNLYETLVQVDCDGRALPGLAASWRSRDGDRRWVFTLRERARSWDGELVTAADVEVCWLVRRRGEAGGGRALWACLDDPGTRVRALDERRLEIRLAAPRPDLPRLLACPAAALTLRDPDYAWPLGTGPCRPALAVERGTLIGAGRADGAPGADDAGVGGMEFGDVVLLPNLHHPAPPVWERLVLRPRPGADPRDLLADADLLVLRDRALEDDLRAMSSRRVRPLGWDRRYLLVLAADGLGLPPLDRGELARHVAVSPARPATGDAVTVPGAAAPPVDEATVGGGATPARGDEAPRSDAPRPYDPMLHRRPEGATILYPAGDADARRLAERLAALARPAGGAVARAQGLAPAEFAAALDAGRAAAYVLGAPRTCGGCDLPPLPPGARAIPLVDTRAGLVAREGLAGFGMDCDGTLLLGTGGWAAGALP